MMSERTIFASAREILGGDIISPDDITSARGLRYSPDYVEQLFDRFPSKEKLSWCRENDYVVIATPPKPISFLGVLCWKSSLFFPMAYGEYDGIWENEKWARVDKTTPGWLIIRKGIIPNSTGLPWREQLRLLSGLERVPNAAELAWLITTYYEVRDKHLFEKILARTSSRFRSGLSSLYHGSILLKPLAFFDWWRIALGGFEYESHYSHPFQGLKTRFYLDSDDGTRSPRPAADYPIGIVSALSSHTTEY